MEEAIDQAIFHMLFFFFLSVSSPVVKINWGNFRITDRCREMESWTQKNWKRHHLKAWRLKLFANVFFVSIFLAFLSRISNCQINASQFLPTLKKEIIWDACFAARRFQSLQKCETGCFHPFISLFCQKWWRKSPKIRNSQSRNSVKGFPQLSLKGPGWERS